MGILSITSYPLRTPKAVASARLIPSVGGYGDSTCANSSSCNRETHTRTHKKKKKTPAGLFSDRHHHTRQQALGNTSPSPSTSSLTFLDVLRRFAGESYPYHVIEEERRRVRRTSHGYGSQRSFCLLFFVCLFW